MRSNIKRAIVATVFVVFTAIGLIAWAAPGHGGGGHGGSGGHMSGGHMSSGHGSMGHMSGGHSSFGHSGGGHNASSAHFNGSHNSGPHYSGNHSFAGVKYSNGFGHINYNHNFGHGGYNYARYANHGRGYYNYGRYNRGWPYRSYAYGNYGRYSWPYLYGQSYFGYPYYSSDYGYPSTYYYNSYPAYYSSYPTYSDSYSPDYYGSSVENLPSDGYANVPAPSGNFANRAVADTARLEIRLPDPQASIWVEGQSIASSGQVRQFNSPQLDPARQFTYDVKAAWIENGKLITDERRVKVQANGQSVIDFTRSGEAAPPDAGKLPPPAPLPPQQET